MRRKNHPIGRGMIRLGLFKFGAISFAAFMLLNAAFTFCAPILSKYNETPLCGLPEPEDYSVTVSTELSRYSLIEIEEGPMAYGGTVQVIDASPSDAKATEPTFEYTGSTIDFRYYNPSGNFKLRIASGNSSSSMSIYSDNALHKIPLIYGNGQYTLSLFEQMSDGRARTIATKTIQCGGTASANTAPATQAPAAASNAPQPSASTQTDKTWNIDTKNPYLTPVVDINWSDSLTSVKKARELCAEMTTDKAKAKAIYDFVVKRMSYDYELVGKLPSGYVPNLDNTYTAKKGICYDIAALYAGMCRSVGVECKLVMGYNTMIEGYHAWNEVNIDGVWMRVDLTIDCQLRSFGSAYSFDSPQGSVTVKKSY